jgi:putative DNA methylase
MSGTPIAGDYIKAEGKADRMGARLMSIVAEGERGRVYLPPTPEHEIAAKKAQPEWRPETKLAPDPRALWTPAYGLTTYGDLFTPRQLVALTTFSDLVAVAMERIHSDALAAGLEQDDKSLRDGGNGVKAYAEAVGVYLSFGVDKTANSVSSLVRWNNARDQSNVVFTRQALPMIWDFADVNPFANAAGDFGLSCEGTSKTCSVLPAQPVATVHQCDAATQSISIDKVISTDPPYYDNIGYADLSDFFYVWLRRSLRPVFPDLLATLAVPKAEELVATPYRHANKKIAETFFLDGMTRAMRRLSDQAHKSFPVTIYYAFKQSENEMDGGISSTGWETFLDAVIGAGFGISGTWPVRTERPTGVKISVNALASSIVLVCNRRDANAPMATGKEFVATLQREMPEALRNLQLGNLAPVDLPQSAIGPGMGIFTRYSKVMEADGSAMSVRSALQLINAAIDEFLSAQESQMDDWTRFAVTWFSQNGYQQGSFGSANNLATARAISVDGVRDAGILDSGAGKVRLYRPSELPADWDPATDSRLTIWEIVHQMIRLLAAEGEGSAAKVLSKVGALAEDARSLCYRLYTICEQKKWADEARDYNTLIVAWPELTRLAADQSKPVVATQGDLGV